MDLFFFLFYLGTTTGFEAADLFANTIILYDVRFSTWLIFLGFYFRCRDKLSILSTSEAEELVEVIIFLFLDHQLHGLAVLLYECMQSLISYFTEKEWKNSCTKITKSLACRLLTYQSIGLDLYFRNLAKYGAFIYYHISFHIYPFVGMYFILFW